ncbi:MAG: HAD family hydrolase [Phycisphaerales bacterium]|nr:HAD family hydrolase [Phycisphaerales bacterium]
MTHVQGAQLRPAVFLDRDDTLIANREVTAGTPYPGDLFDPELVKLLPGVGEGLSALKRAGFALVVVSNQGAVARGRCTIAQVEATNARMRDAIRSAADVELDAVYFCPYHPRGAAAPFDVEHAWRKPAPGMILHAAGEFGLDLSRSWMIGDAARDIEAAVNAGIAPERALLVGEDLDFSGAVRRVLGASG